MTTAETREPSAQLPSVQLPSAQPPSAQPPSAELLNLAPPTSQPPAVETPVAQLVVSPAASPARPSLAAQLRSVGSAVASHPRLVSLLALLLVAGGTGICLLYLLFRGALSQHQNNAVILQTIWKMEIERKDAIALKNNPDRIVTRTFLTLEPHVEADGWTWINRFGSTITYGRQEQRMIASCSPYSPLYLICDLSEIPK